MSAHTRNLYVLWWAVIGVAAVGLGFEIKWYGDVSYKNGCIWYMVNSGHADLVWKCPIYPDEAKP